MWRCTARILGTQACWQQRWLTAFNTATISLPYPYLKVIGTTKHYTGYLTETNRFAFNGNVTPHDLMTYLISWQVLAEQGQNSGVMCAYPALNGVPMCANAPLETVVLREQYGMGQAGGNGSYIQADCGAIEFIYDQHHYVDSYEEAVAVALNAGTDIDCGTTYPTYLGAAIAAGLTNESVLDASLKRTMYLHFMVGRFDPLELQPYTQIPFSELGSPAHAELSAEAAQQGMVLLRS
jgi:beta-D-xylosidase 4